MRYFINFIDEILLLLLMEMDKREEIGARVKDLGS
jgi:hypothetical protein